MMLMREHIKVWLGGVELQSVHPSLLLQGITETAPKYNTKTAARLNHGAWVTSNRRERLEIVIDVAIRERLSYTIRAEAMTALAGWASRGGWLQVSYRPGQRLYVEPAFPALEKIKEWNGTLSFTLTAFAFPFWADELPQSVILTDAASDDLILRGVGTMPGVLEAVFVPKTDTLTAVAISNGLTGMRLDDISVSAGNKLAIYYDSRHILHIENNGASVLANRSGADDIPVNPGENQITYSINAVCDVTLEARGVWV